MTKADLAVRMSTPILGIVISVFVAGPALAIDEITVFATKRQESLQDIGVSVSAFDGDQIREIGFSDTIDIAQQVPNFNVIQFHPTITTMNIRGISQTSFSSHLEPPIAMYVDDAYVSAMGAGHAQMYDMERVEVLRGPQGTLFGRNATGGLLHYISAKPTDEFEAYTSISIGEFDKTRLEGAVSGPLSENVLARFSAAYTRHDGIVENTIGPDPRNADARAFRVQFLWEPSDTVDVGIKYHYAIDDTRGQGYAFGITSINPDGLGYTVLEDEAAVFFNLNPPAPSPDTFLPPELPGSVCEARMGAGCNAWGDFEEHQNNPFKGQYTDPGMFKRKIQGITIPVNWELSDTLTFTSITDYMTMNKRYREDSDGGAREFLTFDPSINEFSQLSQEFRWTGESSESVRWIGGVYLLRIDNHVPASNFTCRCLPLITSGTGLDIPGFFTDREIETSYKIETVSAAVFGNVEIDLTDEWSMDAGLRFTRDVREYSGAVTDTLVTPIGDVLYPFDSDDYPGMDSTAYNNWSALLRFNWRPDDDLLAYASISRGHKAGNYQSTPPNLFTDDRLDNFDTWVPSDQWEHDQEELTNYEVGVKWDFWDNRARINAALFYYDYKDYQGFAFDPIAFTTSIFNADAHAAGGELELTLEPTERWYFLFGLSTVNSKVEDVLLPGRVADVDLGGGMIEEGNDPRFVNTKLPYAPELGANGLAKYEWPVGDGSMAAILDFNYEDDFCFSTLCAPAEAEESYTVWNASLSYSPNDNWTFTAFIDNVTDEEYRVYSFDTGFAGLQNQVFANPRWWGVTAEFRFD